MRRVIHEGYWALGLAAGLAWGCGGSGNSSTISGPSAGSGGGGGSGTVAKAGSGGGGVAPSAGSGGMPERAEGPAQWVVFDTTEGIFAYDVRNYPTPGPKIRLGDPANGNYGVTAGPDWSLDGTRVLDISGDKLVVWDMTGLVPSEGTTLVTGIQPSGFGLMKMWGADNKTVFVNDDKRLYAIDASAPMPQQNVITTTALLYQRAPKGDGLIYLDDGGMNFVHVPGGVPGQSEHADALNADWEWARDGVHFGTCGASVKLFDTSGPQLKVDDAFAFPALREYASSPSFSADTKYFAFNAGNGAEALMYGSLTNPTTVKPLNGLVAGDEGRGASWHPSKPVIVYNVAHPPAFEETSEWALVDFSGAEPSAPVALPLTGALSNWLPDGIKLLMLDAEHKQLSLVDMEAKPPTVTAFAPQQQVISSPWVSPDGAWLGYATEGAVHIADLKAPATPPTTVKVGGQSDAIPYFQWTPDSQYLLVSVSSEKFTKLSVQLARVDGKTVSPFVTVIEPISNQILDWASQPARATK